MGRSYVNGQTRRDHSVTTARTAKVAVLRLHNVVFSVHANALVSTKNSYYIVTHVMLINCNYTRRVMLC